MKIKMKQSTPASPDGIIVKLYKEGEIYEVNKDLGEVLVEQMGVAEKVVFGSVSEIVKLKQEDSKKVDNKAVKNAPQNKSANPKENKKDDE